MHAPDSALAAAGTDPTRGLAHRTATAITDLWAQDGPPMTGSPTPDFSLGPLLADNQPPEVTLIQQIGPFTEGSPRMRPRSSG